MVLGDLVKQLEADYGNRKVAFINTAAEVEEGDHWWIRADRKKLEALGFEVEEFSITGMKKVEIMSRLEGKKMMVVGGGNTFYLLDQTIKSGFGEIIKEKIEEGVVYVGSSAGSMIVGVKIDLVATIDERSKAPDLKSDGLGIIDLAVLPHWGNEYFKEEYGEGFGEIYTKEAKVVPLRDNQYLWVKDGWMQIRQV